jgi:predicted GIY-YIG superfamily endonuclease
MANQKQCQKCHKLKDTTQYSKCKSNKDGLQYKCKECNKVDNLKFRTEINPTHHQKWQDKNWDKFVDYVKKYRKADKVGLIYGITNPEGMVYIGMTQMYLRVRLNEHRRHYRRASEGKRDRLGLLHDSFDKYGIDNHEFKVVKECPGLTREQLKQLESAIITLNKSQNISLNKRN